MTAVEGCRQIAHEIWRVERPAEPYFVHGLSSERAVRDRLQKTAMELEQQENVPDAIALKLMAINFASDDPLSILERTEAMITEHRPGAFPSAEDLIQGSGKAGQLIMRLLIVQSVGGRLGRWAVRNAEIPDARTARALYKDLGEATWSQYRALLEASEELTTCGRHREAAASLLDADRLVRTAAGLLKAATALTKSGDYISALWTVRACLLEQRASFETPAAIERALRLESRLRAVIEGRASVPLSIDESRMLLGEEDPPLALSTRKPTPGKPKPTAELIQRPGIEQAKRLPRKPSPGAAAPPPLKKSAAFGAAPTKVEGPVAAELITTVPAFARSTVAARQPPNTDVTLTPKGELAKLPKSEVTMIPKGDAKAGDALKTAPLKMPPPLAPRKSTLPPNKKHVVLLEAERAEGSLWTERQRIDFTEMEAKTEIPPAPVRAAILGASEVVTARHVVEPAKPPLVARSNTLPPSTQHRNILAEETGDLNRTWAEAKINQGELAQLVSETFELDRISVDAGGEIEIEVDVSFDNSADEKPEPIKAEAIDEEWVVQPALEDLPTDTSMPRPPSIVPQPAVYEITERIRDRVR